MKNEVKNESDTPRKTQREVGTSTPKNLRVVEDKAKKDTVKELPAMQQERPCDVGQMLKAARQKANVSLDEVSWNLRISKNYLEAIEGSRSDAFLERVYTLGFVRSYAAYLGLNVDEIVGRFKSEVLGDSHPFEPLVFLAPEAEASSPRGTILLLSSFVALMCIGGWYMYSHQSEAPIVKEIPSELQKAINQDLSVSDEAANPSSTPLSQSGERLAISAPTPLSDIEDNGPAEEGDPVDTPEEGVKTPAVSLSNDSSSLSETSVAPAPQLNDSQTQALEGAQTETATAVLNAAPASPANALPAVVEPAMVVLTFVERCWVEVRDANQRILIQKTFNKGDTYKVEAKVGRKLSLGNAGGVRISVNQSSPVAIGGTGAVERISLDPLNLSKYSGAQR